MVGAIVKKNTRVIDKLAFGGEDSESLNIINKLKLSNPSLTYEIHFDTDSDWKVAFEQVTVSRDKTQEQTDWEGARGNGVPSALSFLAKKLGLE